MTSILPSTVSSHHGLSPLHGKLPRFSNDWLEHDHWDDISDHGYGRRGYDSHHLLSDWSSSRPSHVESSADIDNVETSGRSRDFREEGIRTMEPELYEKSNNTGISNAESAYDSDEEMDRYELPKTEQFKLSLRLGSKKKTPDNVSVDVKGRILSVRGNLTEELDEEGVHTLKRKAFTHRFKLNELVNVDMLRSELRDDGVLVLRAPLLQVQSYNQSERRDSSTTDARSS